MQRFVLSLHSIGFAPRKLRQSYYFYPDSNRGRGSVVQLRRPATTSTWSNSHGGQQVQRGENTVRAKTLEMRILIGIYYLLTAPYSIGAKGSDKISPLMSVTTVGAGVSICLCS